MLNILFGQENAKSVCTPLPTGYVPEPNSGQVTPQQRSYYQSIIGSLLYLALGTRLDICYEVILMSQFSVNPTEKHISMSDAARQIYWIQSLCSEMGIKTGPIDLCVYNQGAIFLASNLAQEHCSKHIDIKYHHICEAVNEEKFDLPLFP